MSTKDQLILVLLTFVTACHGTRNSAAAPTPTPATSTALPTVAVMAATRPSPSTMPLDYPSPPSVSCSEQTSTIGPLARLRTAMRNINYTQMNAVFDAFLVFHSDEHLSEEPAPEERRLQYISGWDGVGTAAVLGDGAAAIWVSAGDYNRAKKTVSCVWEVYNADDPSQQSIVEWIVYGLTGGASVRPGSNRPGRVGGDARLTSMAEWDNMLEALKLHKLTLVHEPTLLDQLWEEEFDPARRRPEASKIVAMLHNSEYTGMSWQDKVRQLRNEISRPENGAADAMIVTALDEVAWLLNVRGRDVPHAPLLKAFVIVGMKDVRIYVPQGKLSMPVREALNVYACYAVSNCTRVNEYSAIYSDLRRISESKILIPTSGTFQRGASAAIKQSVPQKKAVLMPSPIVYMKAQKNEAEIKGMKKAHLRDAVAMCTLLNNLEKKFNALTEISVAAKVKGTRETQAHFVGISMATRVAFGKNGADPNYQASEASNAKVYKNSTLIIQSGGQYDEGTTVVTRTLHFGTPAREMRTAYTTVLRSLAAMSTVRIPATLPAAHTDPAARAPLWREKQDYPHPTGHGVGAALIRREDPVVIDYRQDANLHTFREGYFITAEPAWYERDKFGARLGNVLEVVSSAEGYLAFSEATLVPFEPKLIDRTLLTDYEIKWLNSYNERIRKVVGPELRDLGLNEEYYWMANKTVKIEPYQPKSPCSGGPRLATTGLILPLILLQTFHFVMFKISVILA